MDRRRNWKQPRTPHETLGLGSDACLDQVKTAYKRLALRYHPDKNTDKFESTKKFREINSAYKELTKKLQKADAAEKKVLGEASEAAFRRYDAQMSSLVGADLIDERDLIAGERKYRQEAMNLFSRTKSRWPQLLQKLKDEFEKRLQARYEEFRKARDSRQIAAENNMRDAIKSAVGQYDTQMNRLCQGDLISHQDLAKKEEEYRRQAIAAFVKQGSQWPFLLKKFEDELKRSLEDQHELYRKRRNEKEAEAEMQLRRTLESAVTRYDDRMTRLGQGHLVSLQELAMKHEDYRKEALETLLEVGVHCPHISQKFEDELEKRLQARHTFHQEARNARETRGKTELRQALESAASRHRIQLRRLFEEDLISEEDMETRDAEYRRQAIATFFIHGSQWPLLSEKFEDELEKRLHADYAIFAKERDAREAAVRLHLKSEMESSIDRYDVQMTLLRDGELISKQEMRMSAAKYRRQAVEIFLNHGLKWPFLLKNFEDELNRRLQAVYETYEKQRNSRQTEVETQLWKEVASTAGRYDDQMSRLCEGDLISEQELVTKEAEFRSLAIATFFKSGLQWPFLLKKFANHLKLRLKMRYEICMKKRAERKREATLLLRNAVASAVIQYENQMNRLCEGDLITELELRRRHENYRGEALKAIFSIGAHCPQISRKFENELEKRLRLRLAVYEEQRNAREAIERHAAIQLKHALSSAAAGYDIQMSRWIEGPLVDEEELRARDAECRRGALAVFSKQASQWPHLSKKFEDELEELLHEGYEKHRRVREGKERQAENELENAVASQVQQYREEMMPFLEGPSMISRKELMNRHLEHSLQAIRTLSERGERYPHISRKHLDELEQILHETSQEYEERRSDAERDARSQLERACCMAAEEYKRRRWKFYGGVMAGWEALLADHEEQVEAALDTFSSLGSGVAEWLVEEFKEILLMTLDTWHDTLEKEMAEERPKRRQSSLVTLSLAVLVGLAVANGLKNSALGTGAVVGILVATWWLTPGIAESIWKEKMADRLTENICWT